MMRCTIWYHLYNLKNVKNTYGGVLLLVKLQALTCNITKSNTPPGVFFMFFKLYKKYLIAQSIKYSFIRTMQPISPIYNWEIGVQQIKITEEKLSQSFILCQLLRTKTLASGSKCTKHLLKMFFHHLSYICWVDVIYLTCLAFLKFPWWLVWIFCAPTPLT